jgi:hypothetical protein
LFTLLVSCTSDTVNVKNRQAGKLTATCQLVQTGEKNILLDYETAPKPPYMQMIKDSSGVRMLTFLNPYNQSIYFYDYSESAYIQRISYEKEGPDAILRPTGYYIKNMDSIYVYNMMLTEVNLTDSAGHVNSRIQLRGDNPEWKLWPLYYPQYNLSTVVPFIEIQGKLLLTGLFPFSVSDSLITKARFTACIDMKTNQAKFAQTYPEKLYGSNANWRDEAFTQVYPELSPSGELVHSFPVSHDVFITKWDTEDVKEVYAGSNTAGTISSIDRQSKTPNEVLFIHYLQQDLYAAIRYDVWRKVYYRFMLKGIPDATSRTLAEEKPVIVILMDEQFNYLGETCIGTNKEWNWTNSFVTEEGLNIEFIEDAVTDLNEEYLRLRIFTIDEL